MSLFNSFVLKVKRGDTVFYRSFRTIARAILQPTAPRLPNWLRPIFRLVYETHYFAIGVFHSLITRFYSSLAFQARCTSVGRKLRIDRMPFVMGHAEIYLGDDVYIGGNVAIFSGHFLDHSRLTIGNGAEINWNTIITVNREVIIEDNARISFDCRISDSDGHPRQADLRLANAPLNPRDIRTVRIGRNAWIGNGSHIMKGVTIGEGAIIGANSVVISDVPAFALALGNPAEVYFKNFGKASRQAEVRSEPAHTVVNGGAKIDR